MKSRDALVVAACALAFVVLAQANRRAQAQNDQPVLTCDSELTALFTPVRPQLGRYEVCATPGALTAVVRPGWRIETVPPLDAFGAAGTYDRPALSRLYGGRRVTVSRGWIERGNRFESVTLISPYPDASLTRLVPGTLVIRHVIIR